MSNRTQFPDVARNKLRDLRPDWGDSAFPYTMSWKSIRRFLKKKKWTFFFGKVKNKYINP